MFKASPRCSVESLRNCNGIDPVYASVALDLRPVDIEAGIMQNFSSAIPVKKIASNRQ